MKRNYEECAAVALKYKSKQAFRVGSKNEHQWLQKNNRLDEACAHMDPLRRTLTDSGIAEVAARYTNRTALKIGDQSVYNAAKKRGILDSVCAHMELKHRELSDEDIATLAKKYKSRSEFVKMDSGAYQTATKRGILGLVCDHMDGKGDRRLTDVEIAAIAKQHTSRRNFKLGDWGAYVAAWRRGLLETVCAHMGESENGFNPKQPAILYHIKLTKPCGEVLHKVGITNRTAKVRLSTFGVCRGIKATILHEIKFPCGADARAKERAVHKAMAPFRYRGQPVLFNGNTEVFSRDATNYL